MYCTRHFRNKSHKLYTKIKHCTLFIPPGNKNDFHKKNGPINMMAKNKRRRYVCFAKSGVDRIGIEKSTKTNLPNRNEGSQI